MATTALLMTAEASSADVSSPPFTGSASALGIEATENLPGAPLTSSPFDGGGPTAQANLDSLGTSQGYAAFPDPGPFVDSIPGLIAGFSSLDGVNLPVSPPNYPLYVQSDSGTNPNTSLGSGPYTLSANSSAASSKAAALAGVQGTAGNTGLVSSTASVSTQSDGSVVAQAVSDVQGLSVGPLTIGEIRSTATETLDSSGTLTPSSTITLTGVMIGSLPVAIDTSGLEVPGKTEPLPINDTLSQILSKSGITLMAVKPQISSGQVVSPAIELTGPVAAISGATTAPGTYTFTLGSTVAQLEGTAASGSIGNGGLDTSSSSASSSAGGTGSTLGGTSTGSVGTPGSSGASSVTSPTASGSSLAPAAAGFLSFAGFDIRTLYLILAAAALAALLIGQVVRLMGVRWPWTSTDG